MESSSPAAYGLVFGWQSDPVRLLAFWVDPSEQLYSLHRLEGGSWTILVGWTLSPAIRDWTASNRLAVRQDGEQIHLYVNSARLAAVPDATLGAASHVGIILWAYNGGWATARFDDFATTESTIAYQDDFSTEESGWFIDTESICQSTYDNRELRTTTAAGWVCLHPAPSYPLPHSRIQFQVRRAESFYPTAYGLAFGGDHNFGHFYALWVSPDSQQFSLFRYDGGWQMLSDWIHSGAIGAGPATNQVALVHDGALIEVHINGELELTMEDLNWVEEGYFGLLNWASPYAPGTAFFDDVRATIWDVLPGQSSATVGKARRPSSRLPVPKGALCP
jgi:hypothetical protein